MAWRLLVASAISSGLFVGWQLATRSRRVGRAGFRSAASRS